MASFESGKDPNHFLQLNITLGRDMKTPMEEIKAAFGVDTYVEAIRESLRLIHKIAPILKDEEGFYVEKLDGTRIYIER